MKRFVFFLLFLSATYSFSQQQPVNVLFIGNSFTHMNALCKIYQNLANSKGKNVFADTIAVSGSTLQGHTERSNTYKKMKARNWDYVFIQGFSRELSYDSATIANKTIPYAQQLIDSIKKYNPCVSVYYYMTWGYFNGFRDSIPGDTYDAMQDRIERGYLQLSQATGGYPVAPVGKVWQQVRHEYPSINLYAPDSAHPNFYGSYAAACTFFTSIYKETPVGGFIHKKVDTLSAERIQAIAANYVLKNYKYYHLDTIQIPQNPDKPTVDFTTKTKWMSVTMTNKSSGGSMYYWDFGDGKSSTQRTPKHYYQKPGKYTVTLYVKSNCNWYKTKRTVKVSNKEVDANNPKPKKKA